jgi:hypothetical protein
MVDVAILSWVALAGALIDTIIIGEEICGYLESSCHCTVLSDCSLELFIIVSGYSLVSSWSHYLDTVHRIIEKTLSASLI